MPTLAPRPVQFIQPTKGDFPDLKTVPEPLMVYGGHAAGPAANVAPLDAGATLGDVIAKINEIITSWTPAGD